MIGRCSTRVAALQGGDNGTKNMRKFGCYVKKAENADSIIFQNWGNKKSAGMPSLRRPKKMLRGGRFHWWGLKEFTKMEGHSGTPAFYFVRPKQNRWEKGHSVPVCWMGNHCGYISPPPILGNIIGFWKQRNTAKLA